MENNSKYTFRVSVSNDAYSNKEISGAMIGTTKDERNREIRKQYGFKANQGIGYKEIETNAADLLDLMINGHVLCNLFNPKTIRKDGTFASCQKKDDNFKGSFIVGVDIDETKFNSVSEFIDKLELKPTFYYTSYSHLQKDKGVRFRMIYVFNHIIKNPYFFRFCAYQVNKKIELDTKELIKDDCNLRCSQYFNGTNINTTGLNIEYGISNNIYDFNDFGINKTNFYNFLINYCYYKSKNKNHTININNLIHSLKNKLNVSSTSTTINLKTEKEEIEVNENLKSEKLPTITFNERLLNDWDRLDRKEFTDHSTDWNKMLTNYHYIYRVENEEWINGLYQYVNDDYFKLFFYFNKKQDGTKRRKTLYERMCLRRIMKPTITPSEITFCTLMDIIQFCDNSDKVLNSDFIKRNVTNCFNLEIEDIKEIYSESIDYLKRTTKPKRGIIYITKSAHSKQTTYYILDEYYDSSLSVNENLELINNVYNFKIGKTVIYEYLKERNIKSDNNKLSDDEIINLLDTNLSVIQNYNILKDSDIKISKNRLYKLYKKYSIQ